MGLSQLEERTERAMLVVPLSRDERKRLDAWAHSQEREASQAIRWALRDVLIGEKQTASGELAAGTMDPHTAEGDVGRGRDQHLAAP